MSANATAQNSKINRGLVSQLTEQLIPFALSGKLLSGMSQLSVTHDLSHINEARRETLRLCRESGLTINIAAFAQLPVSVRIVAGHQCVVDDIGESLFKDALEHYGGQYTVGVVEYVKDRRRYAAALEKHKLNEWKDKYLLDDNLSGECEFAMVPITLSTGALNRGRRTSTFAVSETSLLVVGRPNMRYKIGASVEVIFQPFHNTKSILQGTFVIGEVIPHPNEETRMLTKLNLQTETSQFLRMVIRDYLNSLSEDTPVFTPGTDKEEAFRVSEQALATYAPWLSMYAYETKGKLIPAVAVCHQRNLTISAALTVDGELRVNKRCFEQVAREKTGHIMLFEDIDESGNVLSFCTTFRQADERSLVDVILHRGRENGSLKVFRFNVSALDHDQRVKVEEVINAPDTEAISSVINLIDVTHLVVSDKIKYQDAQLLMPADMELIGSAYTVKQLWSDISERRRHVRLKTRLTARVGFSRFSTKPTTVRDVSESGLCFSALASDTYRCGDLLCMKFDAPAFGRVKMRVVRIEPANKTIHCVLLKPPLTYKSAVKALASDAAARRYQPEKNDRAHQMLKKIGCRHFDGVTFVINTALKCPKAAVRGVFATDNAQDTMPGMLTKRGELTAANLFNSERMINDTKLIDELRAGKCTFNSLAFLQLKNGREVSFHPSGDKTKDPITIRYTKHMDEITSVSLTSLVVTPVSTDRPGVVDQNLECSHLVTLVDNTSFLPIAKHIGACTQNASSPHAERKWN